MSYRANPPTDCETCRWAEMSLIEKIIDRLKRTDVIADTAQSMARLIAVGMGYQYGPNWYQQHRENYEIGGMRIELTRALRHVKSEVH